MKELYFGVGARRGCGLWRVRRGDSVDHLPPDVRELEIDLVRDIRHCGHDQVTEAVSCVWTFRPVIVDRLTDFQSQKASQCTNII